MLGNTGCMCVCMYCARMCLYSSGLSFVLVASTGSCYLVFFCYSSSNGYVVSLP